MKHSFMIWILLTLSACGRSTGNHSYLDEAWNRANDPLRLSSSQKRSFADLMLEAELDRKPWTDTYWPNYLAGIAQRWNQPDSADAFTYSLASKDELLLMTVEQIKQLSPAEKFDILQERFDYPLVVSERARNAADDPSWFGLCHGWAPASINFEEPKPVTVKSPSGIEIPFGSSDIKALLSLLQADSGEFKILGQRCNLDLQSRPEDGDRPECRDTNAGAFHVILANQIGLLQKAFVADMSRDLYVWNHPVFGYKSRILTESGDVYPGAAPGTVRIVTLETSVRYISELGAHWDARPFKDFPYQESTRILTYKLELNGPGDIIGGEWVSEDRPDFLWTQMPPTFNGYLKAVEGVYQASLKTE